MQLSCLDVWKKLFLFRLCDKHDILQRQVIIIKDIWDVKE